MYKQIIYRHTGWYWSSCSKLWKSEITNVSKDQEGYNRDNSYDIWLIVMRGLFQGACQIGSSKQAEHQYDSISVGVFVWNQTMGYWSNVLMEKWQTYLRSHHLAIVIGISRGTNVIHQSITSDWEVTRTPWLERHSRLRVQSATLQLVQWGLGSPGQW